ncbi:MAG: hypothetical protein E6R04_04500 [Spirochaetes bacterium]|nr:MAG: hypothetical protein E6R04_04500 [Spirochaetota bacterium]
MDVRPSFQKRALWISLISGPLAIIISVLTVMFSVITRPPSPVDVYRAQTQSVRAEFFARNYLLLWLGGSDRQDSRLKEMTSVDARFSLNPDPVTVTEINITDVLRTPAKNVGETEWAFTLAASVVPPGGMASRNYYRVTFVEKDGAFQAIVLPRLTFNGVTPIQVDTIYKGSEALDGVLGKTIANFAKAYLTPSDGEGSLGRYVSEKFSEKPVKGSPYTSVRVTAIQTDTPLGQTTEPSPGTTLEVLVTVRAMMSTTTYTTMQLPLRVTMTKNSQWLVDAITEPVDFGNISSR